MASVVHEGPGYERRAVERRRLRQDPAVLYAGLKVSWGGIFGGVLVAVGLMLLLASLGVAIGITATDPGDTEASTVGAGAATWAGVSLLIALFVGGMVSTKIGAITDRTTGFFEGVLVWVVGVLLMAYLAGSGVSMLGAGVFRMAGTVAQTAGTMAGQQSQGVDVSGSVDKILERLRDPGLAQKVASATGMPSGEVQSSLDRTAERVEANRDDPGQAAAEAKNGMSELMAKARSSGAIERKAEELKPGATRAAWIAFAALVVSLVAAVVGAMLGRRDRLPLGRPVY